MPPTISRSTPEVAPLGARPALLVGKPVAVKTEGYTPGHGHPGDRPRLRSRGVEYHQVAAVARLVVGKKDQVSFVFPLADRARLRPLESA